MSTSQLASGWSALLGIGGALYLTALLATLPARLVAPAGLDAAGTVWHGEASIGGGHVAAWHWSPLESLARLGLAGEWTLDGPGSVLRGTARWRPFAGVELAAVAGRAGWPLIALANPSLPFTCDFGWRVALDRVVLETAHRGGSGTVQSESGTCIAAVRGVSRAVPRLIGTFAGNAGRLTPWANRAEHLADWAIAGGVLKLHISAAGASLIPGSPGPSDVEIEL